MAYLDQDKTRSRAASIIAVAAVETAAVFAVITGLTVHFTAREKPAGPIIADHIPLPQPDKPIRERDRAKPDHDLKQVRNEWKSPLPPHHADPLPPVQPGGGTMEGGGTIDPPLPPQPDPLPSFAPKAASPRNAPQSWVTTSDYPTRDLREGNRGRVGFSLTIGADGKVESCLVTRSSGFAGLDDATCRMVTRRARFTPASDETGAVVTGAYSGTIRWTIPE